MFQHVRDLCRAFATSNHVRLDDVFVVSAARTPMGSFGGSLAHLSAPSLGAIAIKVTLNIIFKLFLLLN